MEILILLVLMGLGGILYILLYKETVKEIDPDEDDDEENLLL